jgi:hypothetical protein
MWRLLFMAGSLLVVAGCGGSAGSVPATALTSGASQRTAAKTAAYTVVDVSIPGLQALGLYGASHGFQVGSERLSSYSCGRATYHIDNAYLYQGSASGAVNLHSASALSSDGYGIANGLEVGAIVSGTKCHSMPHAALWKGSAQSFVDLQPTGKYGTTNGTFALGTDGVREVGYGLDGGNGEHAFVWSGTASSAVYLGNANSVAYGVSGPRIVGSLGSPSEAILWRGKGSSVLACSSCYNWLATGIDGRNAVGYGNAFAAPYHALYWQGTSSNAIDLNPTGIFSSFALGVHGKFQVGYTVNASVYHGAAWSGSPGTYVDLHSFLPSGYTASYAYGVDEAGNVVGAAINSAGIHSIIWKKS